ncbi:MAG: YcaO-like family protein [Candidatus Heimdallarchaeota archaeon]
MIIDNVMKNKHTLKCQSYDYTIKRIVSAFDKMGINLRIKKPIRNSKVNSYYYKTDLPELNFTTHGKGTTRKQALASALGEMVERFSANLHFKFFYPDYNLIDNELILQFVNGKHLHGYINIHQNKLKDKISIEDLFRNYKGDLSENQINKIKNMDMAQHWVDGYSLLSNKIVKVPIRLLKILNTSNGLAAGNMIIEAIVQASCEIFERYSLIEIIKNKLILPTFDKNTIKDKTINKMIKNYEKNNIKIMVKDFSLDNLLPVVGVIFINENIQDKNSLNYQFEHIRLSFGASFNLHEAIKRCFTERIAGSTLFSLKRGHTRIFEKNLIKGLKPEITIKESYGELLRKARYNGDKSFLCEGPIISFPRYNEDYNFLTNIENIKRICRKLNTDFVVINHTHPTLQFPTVRVIIPGYSDVLNYYDFRFNDLINVLKYGITKSKLIKLFTRNDWVDDKENLEILENTILDSYIRNCEMDLITKSNELNSLKKGILILISIYYNAKDFEKFKVATKFASISLNKKLRIKFRYLYYLINYYLKTRDADVLTLIDNYYKKLKGCEKYLYSIPKKNPFVTWCDEECERQCEKRYLSTLNEVLQSFFV